METRTLLSDAFGRIKGILDLSLKGLTADQVVFQPVAQTNTIAWLAWHLTRVQDDHMSDLAGHPQAWITEG